MSRIMEETEYVITPAYDVTTTMVTDFSRRELRFITYVKIVAGANIRDAIKAMKRLSKKNKTIVRGSFNGVLLNVTSKSKNKEIVDYYYKELEKIRKEHYERLSMLHHQYP